MNVGCIVRKGTAYISCYVKVGEGGHYHQIEVVGIIHVSDGEQLARKLSEAIGRGTPVVSPTDWRARVDPQLPKLAGVKSWGVLYRTASSWSISEHQGIYTISGTVRLPRSGWTDDPNQKTNLPPGTTAEEACARMVEILQAAEARGKG
jgi:hypothetical protein